MKSNLRDYDKRPLIIEDPTNEIYKVVFFISMIINGTIFLYGLIIPGAMSYSTTAGFSSFYSLKFIMDAYSSSSKYGKCKVVFKNNRIEHISEKLGLLANVELRRIVDINITFGLTDIEQPKENKMFGCIILFFASIILFVMLFRKDTEKKGIVALCLFLGYLFFFLQYHSYAILKNGLGANLTRNSLLVFAEHYFFQLPFLSNKEYKELKFYFLFQKGIDIDKIPISYFV